MFIAHTRFNTSYGLNRHKRDIDMIRSHQLRATTHVFYAICIGLLLVSSISADDSRPITDTRGSLSGNWYDPGRNGEGFIFEFGSNPAGPAATVFWFTHLDGGAYWLIGSVEYEPRLFDQSGLLEFTMTEVSGTGFGGEFDASALAQFERGQLSFVFDSCDKAFATWQPAKDAGPLGDQSIEYQLRRITLGLDGVPCGKDATVTDNNDQNLMEIQGPKVVSVGESFRVTADLDSSDASGTAGFWRITKSDGETYREFEFSGAPDRSIEVSTPGLYTLTLFTTSPEQREAGVHPFAVATELTGNIVSNTRLTLGNSPYRLMDSIQIRQETELAFDAGVLVFGEGHSIRSFGDFVAQGTPEQPVVLHNTAIIPGATQSDGPYFSIQLDNVAMIGGALYEPSGSAIYGYLDARDSLFINLQRYTYIWYPNDKTVLHRNVFWGTGELTFGVRNVPIEITNNLFANYRPIFAGGVIQNWANIEDSAIKVERNSFLDTGSPTLDLRSSGQYSAPRNYWGTTNEEVIQSMINDANADFALPGVIEFRPFLTEPDRETPTLRQCRERIQRLPTVVTGELSSEVCF